MANSYIAETETTHSCLGPVNATKQRNAHSRAVGNARRKTRHGGTIPNLKPVVQGERTNARFVEPGFYERKQRSAFLSCKLAGAMVSKVVNVDSENHAGGSLLGNRTQGIHESVLAPETAVCAIDKVRRVLKFPGPN
jgi:hypothetical protein